MIEDDHYRTSTQYRYWSYTSTQLAHLRTQTNTLAATRVRHALQRTSTATTTTTPNTINPLTPAEELHLVTWSCTKIHEIGLSIHPSPIPPDIRCTAIQYLRRFYLSNSPMTYHPKRIMTCALYLATKASHWHVGITRYVSELEGVSEKDVVGLEFLLLQGLRFTLDVRHPGKGLEGGAVEILRMVREQGGGYSERSVNEIVKKAREVLRSNAQMTDVYFLFTPAQIWLGALRVVDPELVSVYLEWKMDGEGGGEQQSDAAEEAGRRGVSALNKAKLLATIAACADMLASYKVPEEQNEQEVAAAAKEMRRIGKKLHLCQNPETVDGGRAKRDVSGSYGEAEREEKKAKKRKMEKEMRERDADVFGGELKDLKK